MLLLDDRDGPSVQVERLLWKAGAAAARVATLDEAVARLRSRGADVVLAHSDLPGRQAALAATVLPEVLAEVRVFFFGSPNPRLAALANIAAQRVIVIRDDHLASWIAEAMPLLGRTFRDRRRIERACRAHAEITGPTARPVSLPVQLNDILGTVEESLVRAAVEAAQTLPRPSRRKAAQMLGILESSFRTKMEKLCIRWPVV